MENLTQVIKWIKDNNGYYEGGDWKPDGIDTHEAVSALSAIISKLYEMNRSITRQADKTAHMDAIGVSVALIHGELPIKVLTRREKRSGNQGLRYNFIEKVKTTSPFDQFAPQKRSSRFGVEEIRAMDRRMLKKYSNHCWKHNEKETDLEQISQFVYSAEWEDVYKGLLLDDSLKESSIKRDEPQPITHDQMEEMQRQSRSDISRTPAGYPPEAVESNIVEGSVAHGPYGVTSAAPESQEELPSIRRINPDSGGSDSGWFNTPLLVSEEPTTDSSS